MTVAPVVEVPDDRPARLAGIRRFGDVFPPLVALIGALLVWELIVRVFGLKQFILPSPVAIAAAWQANLPELVAATTYTLVEILAGLLIGAVGGIVVGVLAARSGLVRGSLMPFAIAANSIPIIAFAPIFNNWFGVDSQFSKAMIAAVLVFFPVMINTVRGLTNVDPAALVRRVGDVDLPQCPRAQRDAVHLHRAEGRDDARDDRRDRGRVLRRPARQPRPVHRDAIGVPGLRSIVGGDHLRRGDRHRPVPHRGRHRASRQPMGTNEGLDGLIAVAPDG
jgi:hypothetical protein